MSFAAFVLSTGRCGTQWIATSFREVYRDRLDVAHEPLQDKYDARSMLANRSRKDENSQCSPLIAAHLDDIEAGLGERSYLECGHPNWAAMPLLVNRFRSRVRIIYLTRHPVPCSYSWLAHGVYQPPILPHIPAKELLSPFDEGVRFSEYQADWGRMSPFEKCLYYWTEVNAFGEELCSRVDVPWLHLRYEDLFDANGLDCLLQFLELPVSQSLLELRGTMRDQFRYVTASWDDWRVIANHSPTLALAERLGYDMNGLDDEALRRRYLATP